MYPGDTQENLLHFIWFGREITKVSSPILQADPHGNIVKKIGEKVNYNMERLVGWAIKNPHYKICLWTDSNSYGSSISFLRNNRPSIEVSENFDSIVDEGIPRVLVLNFDKDNLLRKKLKALRILGVESELRKLIDYFRNPENVQNSAPNYGAASDIARCMILYAFGGIYMDFDTVQSKNVLPELSVLLESSKILLSCDDRDSMECSSISNDVICVKKHSEIMSNYLLIYSSIEDKEKKSIVAKIGGGRREDTTKYGPVLLRYLALYHLFDGGQKIMFSNNDDIVDWFRMVVSNEYEKMGEISEKISAGLFKYYDKRGMDNGWLIIDDGIKAYSDEIVRKLLTEILPENYCLLSSEYGVIDNIEKLKIALGGSEFQDNEKFIIPMRVNVLDSSLKDGLTNNHWVALVKDEGKFIYIDPMGYPMNNELQTLLAADKVFDNEKRPQVVNRVLHEDGFWYIDGEDKFCGPFLVQTLKLLTEGESIENIQYEMSYNKDNYREEVQRLYNIQNMVIRLINFHRQSAANENRENDTLDDEEELSFSSLQSSFY